MERKRGRRREEIVGEGMEKREGHSKKGERERDKEEKRKTFAQTK